MSLPVQRLEWTVQEIKRRRGQHARRELAARQKQGGLSVAGFCQREWSAWSLYDCRKRLRSAEGGHSPRTRVLQDPS
jgi:hypothetical protein